MSDTLSIMLPHPPSALRPNGRVHWAAKARAVKDARTLAKMVTLSMVMRTVLFVPRSYALTWYYKGSAPDADNCLAACKAYLDGCCAAFKIDDRHLECTGIHRVHSKEYAGELELVFTGTGLPGQKD